MAVKLEASLDDKKFVGSLERMIAKLNETKAASKKTSDGIDRDFRDNSIGSLEEVGKRMGRLRALINNVALAGVGMKIIGQVGAFASETMGQAAEEVKGLNKELYDSAKSIDTFAKAIRFDIGGVFKNVIFKDVEFETAKLEKKHNEMLARAKAVDARQMFMGEKKAGVAGDNEETQKRITALVLQREAALASMEAAELSRFQNKFKRYSDIIEESSAALEDDAKKMTAYESLVQSARLNAALAGEAQRKLFDVTLETQKAHEALNEELGLQTKTYQDIKGELDRIGTMLKENKVDAADVEKTQQRFQKLLARQVEMKREELAIEEQLRKANLERFAAEEKARQEARKDRADKVGAAVNQMLGARGGDGAQTRRRGLGSMIPGMMFKGPGIFGGPGISGGIMPDWPGMEGGGGPGDIGGMAADAQRQGVRAAIRGRQDAIMPNLADIPKKFAEERAQRQRDFDAIKAAIADVLGREGNRDDLMAQAGRIGQAAKKQGIARFGKDGELLPNFGDIDRREGGARGEAMRDARRRRARVPRQVAEEIERGEAPKDVAAGQEAAFNKVAEALAKKVGGDQATRDALAALMKQAVATQKDADEALKVAREAMRVIEALAANKGQRAFKP